jgi:hypothetical protein
MSAQWNFTNTGTGIPVAPTLLTPANGGTDSGVTVDLTWSQVSGATDYYLIVSTNSNLGLTTGRKFAGSLGDVQTWTNSTFPANGTVYYWAVWAGNASGYSPMSAQWNFTNVA